MTDESQSLLAIMLDGIADVPADYPFPKTMLARLFGEIIEDMGKNIDDPRMIDMGERVLAATRKFAAAEHFQ